MADPGATSAVPVTPPPTPPDYYDDDDEYQEPPSRTGWFIAGLVVLIAALIALLLIFADALGIGGGNQDPDRVEVPGVIDLTEEEATAQLTEAGFLVVVDRQANTQVDEGIVYDQDPLGGELAPEESEVTIVVSDGQAAFPMPEVVGFREPDVIASLQSQGLVLAEGGITRRFDDQAPEGEVLEQFPAPATEVRPGDEFTLVVSQGPEIIEIPDVTGQPVADATRILTESGFQVREESENSSSVSDGNVIRTEPGKGESAARDSVVVIVVSSGPPPIVYVTVPDVRNQTQATAESQLTSRGLNPSVSFGNSPTVPSGSVISQSVAPGASVPTGTAVGIVVSQGAGSTTSTTAAPP